MSTKLRKSKRKNLAESTSSDEQSDDDSDNAGFKKSSRANKQKKKYCESLSNLCDDSSSDKEGQKLYKSRSASRLANSKTQNESIVIDLSDSASESAGKSNAKESKAKRRRKSSSESSFESFKKEQKSSKKLLAKIKKKKVDDNDSSFSTELQQPQRKKMKSILAKSFEKYDLNDQSVVNTPSRAEEEKLPVESAQEISFKHYVIQEIKKFQEMSNKLQEDLQLNNDYLLKKKINTVCDAKFFIHKILKLYESTCSQFRENRREFTKIYEGWMNEVSKKPKEAEGKKRFNLTTDESDVEINNITKNGKISPQKQKKQEEDNKRSRDNSIEPKDDESRLKGPKQSKLKLKSNNSSRASCSKIVAQASDVDDSPMQASGCDSEVIFSSEETKSKRKSKIAEKDTTGAGVSDEKVAASKEKTTANTQEKTVASSNSDSEDLFDTSTGEVASTPVRSIVAPRVSIPPPPDHDANEVDEEMAEVAEVDEEMAEVAEVAEVAKVVGEVAGEADEMAEEVEEQPAARKSGKQGGLEVEDPKELQALRELMDDDDSSDSSGLEADVEDVADDKDEPQTKNTSGSSKPEALPAKAKILRKQTKKRSLIYSDSSSSDEAQETLARPKGRAARNKSATEDQQASASLRTAPRQKGTFELLRNNRFYLADEKLRRRCRVALERLPKATLAKYAAALEKSKNYVERKKIQSLANLDNLEKKKKKNKTRGDAGSLDADLQEPPKKSKTKDEKKSVVDYLGKASGEVDSGDESSGEKDNGENHSAPTADDDEQNQHDSESNAKEALLRESSSSSSSSDEQVNDSTIADEDSKKQKVTQAKGKKKGKKSNDGSGQDEEEEEKENEEEKDDDDDETDKMKEKSDWRKDKLLNFKLDGSDTEEEKFEKSQEKKKAKQSDNSENDKEEEDKSSSPLKKVKNAKKSRKTRRILDSDSDAQSPSEDDANENSSDADEQQEEQSSDQEKDKQDKNNKKRRRRKQSSDSDSQSDGKKPKSKRRRIKKVASDSEDSDADSPGKGRKNIRKVLKDKYVTDDTKKAAQEEEERLKRIADRQKLFNDMYEKRLAGEEKVEKLVLDIDEETKEELVVVDKELAKRLKPHQARGIKFMWDACYESIDQIEKSEGSGCIIAHCMGLGKTFQVVTLAHTLLTHEKTGVRTVMIVCPLSTVLNWANEFNMWLKHVKNSDEIEIFEMTKLKKNIERKCTLENWRNYGGVLIIGYEMFRNLTSTGKKMRKNMQESIMKSLVDPGADLVVCDEGHLLKNEDSALSKAMRLVKTMRRIVLTGTPLQNNLKEYHCMVQFVKPNLLGTKKEFLNRFVNPITNGQFDDSTPYDVKLMKKRAHVLHKMLEGSVQRFDYNVLTPFLPPKQEYVMFVRLTEVQIKMYRHYLDNFARRLGGRNVTLFADFQALQRIWTHPYVMMLNAEKTERANEKKRLEASDSEGSLKDFIDDDSTSESESESEASSNSSDVECLDSGSEKAVRKRGTRANPVKEEEPEAEAEEETAEETAWWSQFVDEQQHFNDLRVSTKLMLLFAILKESESIGDKVLVFSQSLYSLTLIEHFLNLMDEANQQGADAENLDGHTGSWSLGIDYFRLDGSTSAENRSIWSKIFNNPKNTRARLFLISTRAGGLGINLIGANRVIIFDASWNPSHDVQSIFRIYRFGQKKPCYVYRFLAAGTMEEKIYNRQVTKLSLACRVVDEQQIERHYSNTDLAELYQFDTCEDQSETLSLPKDRLLAEIFIKYKDSIVKCHEHDSLLENKEEEELDEEERKQAWAEYEEEKKGIRQQYSNVGGNNFVFNQMLMNMNVMPEFQGVKQLLQKDYPDVPPEHLDVLARQAMYDMYRMVDQQAALGVPSNFGVAQQNPYGTSSTIQQEAIMNQQSRLMNPQQPVQANYFPVNQMPVYSGRGRPPKFTSVNNQIVNNPMYMANAQALQHPVPNDNEIQILDDESSTVSSNKEANN